MAAVEDSLGGPPQIGELSNFYRCAEEPLLAQCTPEHPMGAPMVSTEGACSAYHAFRRYEDANDGV